MTNPSVSVIMINRNGGDLLRVALRSCRNDLESTWKRDPCFELLFVDNGSTDESVRIASCELKGASFPWRIVEEACAGVNFSRNRGLVEAKGDLLVYTDSDLTFQLGWLQGYLTASKEHPSIDLFAGRICLGQVHGPLPAWLDLSGPYSRPNVIAQFDAGLSKQVLSLNNSAGLGPAGPSMAARRSVFARYGPFDTRFGLRPGSLVAGAEAEFFERLGRAGMSFVYVPDAVVYHPVRRDQLTKGYFLRRLHGVGRVQSRLQYLRGAKCKRLAGMTLYVFTFLGRACVAYCRSALLGSKQERFYYRCEVARYCGYLHEDLVTHWGSGVQRSDVITNGRCDAEARGCRA